MSAEIGRCLLTLGVTALFMAVVRFMAGGNHWSSAQNRVESTSEP
jgi:hypothetical protein